MRDRRGRLGLALILAAYLLLALSAGVLNPLFEAPDEQHHFFTALYIAQERRLPVVGDPWLRQEAAQPPLYYLLSAAVIAPLRLTMAEAQANLVFNPDARPGDPTSSININAFVHTAAENWPWRGPALAAHVLRALSAVIGAFSLAGLYGCARQMGRDSAESPPFALLTVALTAFLPQFLFIHSAISNDPLITLLSILTVWQLLRLWYGTLTPGRLLSLGLTIDLAALTKNQGLALLALALAVLVWRAMRRREPRRLPGDLALTALPALALIIPLLWRNARLYGDLTAANQFIALAGGDRGFTLAQAWGERGQVWTSLIAAFGWQNVLPPGWVYTVWQVIALLGLGGALAAGARWLRRAPRRVAWTPTGAAVWLIGWLGLVVAGWLSFLLRTPAAQGRLLFPALPVLAMGLAGGLMGWRRRWLPPLASGAAWLTALVCIGWVLPAAYRLPSILPSAALPAEATLLNRELRSGVWLVAASLTPRVARAGDPLDITLYWRLDAPQPDAPRVAVQLTGRGYAPVGGALSQPGRGQFPMTAWPVDRLIADRFQLLTDPNMAAPVETRLFVALEGENARVWAGAVKIRPISPPAPLTTSVGTFDAGLTLAAAEWAEPGQTVPITLTWQATTSIGQDWTIFIHLLAPDGSLAAQDDGPPLAGDYPTHWWESGEQLQEVRSLALSADLPPGVYSLALGLYDATLVRAPAYVDGVRQPADLVHLGQLRLP